MKLDIYTKDVAQWYLDLLSRLNTYLHDFIFFETHSTSLDSITFDNKLEHFINTVNTFDEDDFAQRISYFFESSFTNRRLNREKIAFVDRINYFCYKLMYSQNKKYLFNYVSVRIGRKDPLLKPILALFNGYLDNLCSSYVYKKIVFFKEIYYYPDDVTGIRNLAANVLENEAYPNRSYVDNYIVLKSIELYFFYFKQVMLHEFEDFIIFGNFFRRFYVIFQSFGLLVLSPFTSKFWSFLKKYSDEWNYLSRTTHYERVTANFFNSEATDVSIKYELENRFFLKGSKKKAAKPVLVRNSIKSLKSRRPNSKRFKENVYAILVNNRRVTRYRPILKKRKPILTMRIKPSKTFKRYRRLFPSGKITKLPYFWKNFEIFREFLITQNLSTAEQEAYYSRAVRSLSSMPIKKRPMKFLGTRNHNLLVQIDKHLLDSNFLFSISTTSLNYYKIPNLEVIPESRFLFDVDASFGQPYNLRAPSNPAFFWDEWDTSFIRQQNGLSQENDFYEDSYLGEERFFSSAIPAEYTTDAGATKDDSTDLLIKTDTFLEWRFHPERTREPHRKFRFMPFSSRYMNYFNYYFPSDSHEVSKSYRERPDWNLVPGLQNNDKMQEEVIVGDGPVNRVGFSIESADNVFRPEFVLSNGIDDPFDSTILYDWYTLQRVQSAFSERHPHISQNKIRDRFSLPYASSILNCEDYFYRSLYKENKRIVIGRHIPRIEWDGDHYFWDIHVELPSLHPHYNSKENLKETADRFTDLAISNSLGFFPKGWWQERLSRNPILKFSNTLFENFKIKNKNEEPFRKIGVKQSRAYFYDERSLNKNFNKSFYYGAERFSWASLFFLIICLCCLVLHVLFKYLSLDNISHIFYGSPVFEFWDDILPAVERPHRSHVRSRYGQFLHQKIDLLKYVYLKYSEPEKFRYNELLKKQNNKNWKPLNVYQSFMEGPPHRIDNSRVLYIDGKLKRSPFGHKYSPYRLLDRYFDGLPRLGSRKKAVKQDSFRISNSHGANRYLESYITSLYDLPASSVRSSYLNIIDSVHSRFIQRSELSEDSFLGDILYKHRGYRFDRATFKYKSVMSFSLASKISGVYGINNQYIVHEAPHSTDVSNLNFLSRANRVFNNNKVLPLERYHASWRPYDIFFNKVYRAVNYNNLKPPLTALVHEQNLGLGQPRVKTAYKKKISYLLKKDKNIWNDLYPITVVDTNWYYLDSFYRFWNRLWRYQWWEIFLPYEGDDFINTTVSTKHTYFVKQRPPSMYFYNDNVEKASPKLPVRKLDNLDLKVDLRLVHLLRRKMIEFANPDDGYDSEVLARFRTLNRGIVPPVYDGKLSDISLKESHRIFKDKDTSIAKYHRFWGSDFDKWPIYFNVCYIPYQDCDVYSLHNNYTKEDYPLKSLSFIRNKKVWDVEGLKRKPTFSYRNRLFKYYSLGSKKRVLSTLLPFGLDPFKVNVLLTRDEQPIFKKTDLPFIDISKAISFNNLDNLSSLRFFLLLDNASNKVYSSDYTAAQGFKSYWFSKIRLDPVSKSHHKIMHSGSSYQTSFLLKIPTFWESHYNSLWVKNLKDTYRTTSSYNYGTESIRDYSFGQNNSFFYILSFVQSLFLDEVERFATYVLNNSLFLRNLLFFLSIYYIFFNHNVLIKNQYRKLRKINSFKDASYDNLANKSLVARLTRIKKIKIKSFSIPLFKYLSTRYRKIQKDAFNTALPELYNSGGRTQDKKFLKRPKSFQNKLYSLSGYLTNNKFNVIKVVKTNKKVVVSNFSSIIDYSFLWSLHNSFSVRAKSLKRRQNLYTVRSREFFKKLSYKNYIKKQFNNNLFRYTNQNLFYEKRTLPYTLTKQSLFLPGYSLYNKQIFNQDMTTESYSNNILDGLYKPPFHEYEDFTFKNNKYLNNIFASKFSEDYKVMNKLDNNFYKTKNNFSRRRISWSISRSRDRRSRLLAKSDAVAAFGLEKFTKNLERESYSKLLNIINTDNSLVDEGYIQKRAVDELLSFNIGFIDLSSPYSNELNSIITEQTGPLLDLDEDDSDERVEDAFDHDVEPADQVFPIIPESDDTEDHFESIFIELVYKISSPESSIDLSINSLLSGKTSKSVLNRVATNPVNVSNTYNIHSELINYKLWRLQPLEYYNLNIPVLELSLPISDFDVPDNHIVHKLHFNPINFGMPTQYTASFLVPYSLPRFLKRLKLISDSYCSTFSSDYDVPALLYYDPSDPEGFDIKPVKWLAGVNKERPNRFSQSNRYQLSKQNSREFCFESRKLSNSSIDHNSLNNNNFNEGILTKIDLFGGGLKYSNGVSLLSEDFFSALLDESTDLNGLSINELSHGVYSFNVEEEDEAAQFFQTTAHYKWRFLSREYLLNLINRPSEFNYTQLKPYFTLRQLPMSSNLVSSENFNFNKFLKPMKASLYYSEFGQDSDLINDFIAHWPEQPEIKNDGAILDLLLAELDIEGDDLPTSFFDEFVGEEDPDLFEDSVEHELSSTHVILEDDQSSFDIGFDLLLRDVDVSDFSLEGEDMRLDSALRSTSRTMFMSKASTPGFAMIPFKDKLKPFIDDENHFHETDYIDLVVSNVDKYKNTQDPSSPVIDLDLADLLIPMSQSRISGIFQDNDQVILADTMDRVIGFLKPNVIKRGKADLLYFRREIINKNLDPLMVENVYSDKVNNRDLITYLVLVQSPELSRGLARAKYAVVHEIEQASTESINELDEHAEMVEILAGLEEVYFGYEFEKFRLDLTRRNFVSDIYEREVLKSDFLHYLDPYFNLLFRDSNSLKYFTLNHIYFKTSDYSYENVTS